MKTSDKLLVVAIARARNTGMKVFNDSRIVQRGRSPVVMEPVKAEILIGGKGPIKDVHVLDHSGRRTGKTIAVAEQTFTIDGARDKTCYYLVTF